MAIRKVDFELEAKLTGTGGGLFAKPSGKLERKSYSDGGERLKVSLRKLKVADHSVVSIFADGIEIAQIPIVGGSGRFDQEGAEIALRAKLETDQTIEVTLEGVTLLRGGLYCD